MAHFAGEAVQATGSWVNDREAIPLPPSEEELLDEARRTPSLEMPLGAPVREAQPTRGQNSGANMRL